LAEKKELFLADLQENPGFSLVFLLVGEIPWLSSCCLEKMFLRSMER
jgi:hypothetical protein